jgi:NAD-dependent dihydropyrimidine dehydrogenase PreA subunit
MAKRKIINIDEDKCNGCGECIPNCPEGAIQVIDNKARLISDIFCDGLGACIGKCPVGAITTEEREAKPYDELKVIASIVKQGDNVVIAHLRHLNDHGETKLLNQALGYLKDKGISLEWQKKAQSECHSGCPGSKMMDMRKEKSSAASTGTQEVASELSQWPIQFHLISPNAPYFKGSDLLMTADCVAFAAGNYHQKYLKGKSLVIACPKLDSEKQVYVDKLISLIDDAKINTLTVMIMEVPCCRGLEEIAKAALQSAKRKIPLKTIVVGIKGGIISEDWTKV